MLLYRYRRFLKIIVASASGCDILSPVDGDEAGNKTNKNMKAQQIKNQIEWAVEDVRSAMKFEKSNKTPAAAYLVARATGRVDLLLELFPTHEAWARLQYANY